MSVCETNGAISKLKILIQNCSMYFISALCVFVILLYGNRTETGFQFRIQELNSRLLDSVSLSRYLWFWFEWTNTVPILQSFGFCNYIISVVKIIIIYFPDIRFIHLWNNQMYEPVLTIYMVFVFTWVFHGKASGTGRRTKDTTLFLTGPNKWLRYDCFGYLT